MSSRRIRTLLPAAALAVGALLAGCGGSGGTTSAGATSGTSGTPSASSGTTVEPAPAQAEASAEAAADPAAATDPRSAALAVALRATDLPAGWRVQANPVPDGDLSNDPSLAGICGASFPSEAHRTAKFPVVGLDPSGAPAVVSEAISYDHASSGAAAIEELRAAFAACPAGDRTMLPAPRVEGLAAGAVVVEYQLPGGTRQEVIAQQRGAVLSILIGEDERAAAGAARAIAGRLAALPPGAVGS